MKILGKNLITPLQKIFSISILTGSLPKVWNSGIIAPIFKKGDPSDPNNYRPVTITCVSCRILESIINERILKYILANRLITSFQYGFLPKKSCESQLLSYLNEITLMLDRKVNIDSVYLDFAKAFDSVSHTKLLYKLTKYGITGNLLLWIQQFLSNRFQRVRINSSLSELIPVTSGVPQGSVLGPLLFLLYINDISDLVLDSSTKMYIFADDVKILSPSSQSDVLLKLLENVHNWSEAWQLSLSIIKCSVMHFGFGNLKRNTDLTTTF